MSPLWNRLPFSHRARYREASTRFIAADAAFRLRLRAELARLHLDTRRSEHTVFEEMLEPTPSDRPVWVREGVIGYATSGSIAKTRASSPDDPEVVEKVHRFKELASAARKWPEFVERQAWHDKLHKLR